MSENVCYTDAYTRAIEAKVTAVEPGSGEPGSGEPGSGEPGSGGPIVSLDRTVFYPGGGGQPSDRGVLRHPDGREWAVSGARKIGDDVVHQLELPAPGIEAPAIGDRVTAEIEWDRRYALMRTHTALHTLCGVIWRDYRAQVTGGNMEPGGGRMDFEFETMSGELVGEIEARVNAELLSGRDVRVATLPRAEAFAIPDLIRTKIDLLPEGISEIRTIEIVGLDLQADGGTHVANTREVGTIRVIGYESKGRINKRIRIELAGTPSSSATRTT